MKILWLSHLVPYPPKGGVLQRSYNLVKEVSRYHDVTLLAFIQPDLLKSMFSSIETGLSEARQHLSEFCEQIEFVEIPCERTEYGKHLLALKSLFTRDPYSINWLKSEKMISVIRNVQKTARFDLIHFDTISLAPFLGEFPGSPKVLDHHNIESHMMIRRAEQEHNFLKRFYFHQEGEKLLRYEKEICNKFNLQITCSELDSRRLAKIDDTLTIHEIPNGVDVDYFYPRYENELENNLIFAGRLNWYPNEDAMRFFAREIWPLVQKKEPSMVMNVVGSSPHQELQTLASTDNNFVVHGFVDDVRDYISMASVYVCPIRDGGGTKLKLLDAFAMGMATVAHPTACEGLDVEDGHNVLMASSPSDFAQKIDLLLKNPERRRTIGKNARKLAVDRYSFAQIGKDLSELYFQTISNSHNP